MYRLFHLFYIVLLVNIALIDTLERLNSSSSPPKTYEILLASHQENTSTIILHHHLDTDFSVFFSQSFHRNEDDVLESMKAVKYTDSMKSKLSSYQTNSQRLLRSKPHGEIKLICAKSNSPKWLDDNSDSEYYANRMISHTFPRQCPETYDYKGQLHHSDTMCVSSSQEKVCIFEIENVIINRFGGLIQNATLKTYIFDHPTMAFLEPIHYHSVHIIFHSYFRSMAQKLSIPDTLQEYDIVIPTRMIWDNIFNHISHQSLPFIAHLIEFVPKETWSKAYWHCSLHTAALLLLLNIPEDRLLIQSSDRKPSNAILARKIVLPWIPGWTPPQTASFRGIANRIIKIITANLYAKFKHVIHFNQKEDSSDSNNNNNNSGNNGTTSIPYRPKKRSILYLSRPKSLSRHVINNDELITLLEENINKEKYEFIIIGSQADSDTIDELHRAWYERALIFSTARVIIGPHGSAFGHLIWAPDDVEYIEFNVFQDHKNFTSYSSHAHARPAIINSAWAKGGFGKFYNIEPSEKNTKHYYIEDIRVSPYELLQCLLLMKDEIIKTDYNQSYVPEKHIERKCERCQKPSHNTNDNSTLSGNSNSNSKSSSSSSSSSSSNTSFISSSIESIGSQKRSHHKSRSHDKN